MMKMYKSKLIKTALNEEGYLEKASPSFLNSKTKNAGYNNYTKYGRDYGWNGVYWCCIFVWWCFWKAFGNSSNELILKTASCEIMRQHFVKKGKYGAKPKKGALIFFKVGTKPGANHIGLVYKVSGSTVYTIEGNTSAGNTVVDNGGGVARKSYSMGYSNILGYGYPDYDSKPLTAPKPSIKSGTQGASVVKLQKCLNKTISADLTIDGDYGKKTADAVKSFKVKYKIRNIDGNIYGKAMYKKLKKILKKGNGGI